MVCCFVARSLCSFSASKQRVHTHPTRSLPAHPKSEASSVRACCRQSNRSSPLAAFLPPPQPHRRRTHQPHSFPLCSTPLHPPPRCTWRWTTTRTRPDRGCSTTNTTTHRRPRSTSRAATPSRQTQDASCQQHTQTAQQRSAVRSDGDGDGGRTARRAAKVQAGYNGHSADVSCLSSDTIAAALCLICRAQGPRHDAERGQAGGHCVRIRRARQQTHLRATAAHQVRETEQQARRHCGSIMIATAAHCAATALCLCALADMAVRSEMWSSAESWTSVRHHHSAHALHADLTAGAAGLSRSLSVCVRVRCCFSWATSAGKWTWAVVSTRCCCCHQSTCRAASSAGARRRTRSTCAHSSAKTMSSVYVMAV